VVIVIFLNKNSNSNAQLLRQEDTVVQQTAPKKEIDSNAESDSKTAPTGLLARAKKKI